MLALRCVGERVGYCSKTTMVQILKNDAIKICVIVISKRFPKMLIFKLWGKQCTKWCFPKNCTFFEILTHHTKVDNTRGHFQVLSQSAQQQHVWRLTLFDKTMGRQYFTLSLHSLHLFLIFTYWGTVSHFYVESDLKKYVFSSSSRVLLYSKKCIGPAHLLSLLIFIL